MFISIIRIARGPWPFIINLFAVFAIHTDLKITVQVTVDYDLNIINFDSKDFRKA